VQGFRNSPSSLLSLAAFLVLPVLAIFSLSSLHSTLPIARKFYFRLPVLFPLIYIDAARTISFSRIEALETSLQHFEA
jgi:hypothetical protein